MNIKNKYYKNICSNKKARFNYEIETEYEAGIALLGSEVKSIRLGQASIQEGYATVKNNEMIIFNLHIQEYKMSNRFKHEPLRIKTLLMHRREINKLAGKVKTKGYSLIPLNLYINNKNKQRNLSSCKNGSF